LLALEKTKKCLETLSGPENKLIQKVK